MLRNRISRARKLLQRPISTCLVFLLTLTLTVSCGVSNTNQNSNVTTPVSSVEGNQAQLISRQNSGINIGVTSENSDFIDELENLLKKNKIQNYHIHKGGSFVLGTAFCDGQIDAMLGADSNVVEASCPNNTPSNSKVQLYSMFVEFALHKDVIANLGWDNREVSLGEVLNALETGKVYLASSTPPYSNSGNKVYTALAQQISKEAGKPTIEFEKETVERLKAIYSNRKLSSESSSWLMANAYQQDDNWWKGTNDGFPKIVVGYNTLFNNSFEYHGKIIDYPSRPQIQTIPLATPLGSLPTAFVNQAHPQKETIESIFNTLANSQLANNYNSAKKANDKNTLPPFTGEKIREGINAYNSDVRNATNWILVLDTSGSMSGEGIKGLKNGVIALVDPNSAQTNGVYKREDSFLIIPFNTGLSQLNGNSREELANQVSGLGTTGGTNLYSALEYAVNSLPNPQGNTLVIFSDGNPGDKPSNNLVQRFQEFVANGNQVILVGVGNISENGISQIAGHISAQKVVYSNSPEDTAQEFFKGIASAL